MRTALFTALAMAGFAANSLLTRAALADGGRLVDPASFTPDYSPDRRRDARESA